MGSNTDSDDLAGGSYCPRFTNRMDRLAGPRDCAIRGSLRPPARPVSQKSICAANTSVLQLSAGTIGRAPCPQV